MTIKLASLCRLGFLAITLLTTSTSHAALESLSAEQKEYVQSYIEAVNTDSQSKLDALMHKSWLGCITNSNKDFYEHMFNQALGREIPATYKVSFEKSTDETVDKEVAGAQKRGMPYPTKPTHLMEIDYSKGEYSFVTISRRLVLDGGKYYEVSGCPNDELVERFRQIQVRKKADAERAVTLFKMLDGELLSEVTSLMEKGQRIQAWKRYSEVTGESLGMAKQVLSNIQLSK